MPSFSKDTVVTFCTQIATFVLLAICNVILARTLGPSGRGVVSICILIPSVAALIVSFDIGVGNVYFTGSRKYSTQSLVGSSSFIGVSIGTIASILLVLLVPWVSHRFLDGEHYSTLYLAATFPVLITLVSFLSGILLGLRKIIQLSAIQIFNRALYAVFLFLLMCTSMLNVFRAILAYGFVNLLSLLMIVFWMRREGYKISFRPQLRVSLDLLKYSTKNYFGSVFQRFNYRLDIFLVAYFLRSSDVGTYTIAVSLAELVWYIPNSVGYVLFPQTSASNPEEADRFTPIVARNTLFATLIASLLIFLAAGWIIPLLFGRPFMDSILPVRILLPGIVALGLWKVICNDMAGRGSPQYKSYGAGISLVIVLLLDVVLIPRFGIVGAALASSIAYVTATILAVFWFVKLSRIPILDMLIPVRSDLRYLRALLKIAQNKG